MWLLRFRRATPYRGGAAQSMPAEFLAYGLPAWSTYMVGALKISAAICLILGIWFPMLIAPAAILIACLMVGAIAMHLKINDPLKKSVPAMVMLLCSIGVIFLG